MKRKFGKLIGEARRKKEITLRKLAQLVNISPGYLSEIENGRRVPPKDDEFVENLAVVLDLDPAFLKSCATAERAVNRASDFFSKILGQNGDLAFSLYRATEGKSDSKLNELGEALKKTIKDWEEEEK